MKEVKKYIIWFMIWLLWIWTLTYAADNGSIGALFEKVWNEWKLLWSNIKDWTVDSTKIEDNTITSADIMDNTITSADIMDNTITSADIMDNTITSADIMNNTITSADILNGTIQAVDLAPNVLSSIPKLCVTETISWVWCWACPNWNFLCYNNWWQAYCCKEIHEVKTNTHTKKSLYWWNYYTGNVNGRSNSWLWYRVNPVCFTTPDPHNKDENRTWKMFFQKCNF